MGNSDDDTLVPSRPGPAPSGPAPRGPDLENQARIGRYVLLEKLGSGGMGVVYAAFDPDLDRRVALKLLRADLDARLSASEGQARLLREAQAMAKLSHPHVVHVHDVGVFGRDVFVAMELVEGSTLTRWLKEAPRPWREVLSKFREAGRGLAAAHAAGLVHRDFKPDNVLVGAGAHSVKVTDFGLAVSVRAEEPAPPPTPASPAATPGTPFDAPLTATGTVMGTPGYMAPEQHLGHSATAAADQFAFCVALYEALYGQRPFEGASLPELSLAVVKGRLRPPPKSAPVPAWLWRVLQRGLANDAEARFPSMDALLEALAADPARTRNRALGALAAAAVLAVVGTVLYRAGEQKLGLCRGAEKQLAGLWDPARRTAVTQAFVASGRPGAADAAAAVARAFEGFGSAWAAMYQDACEATRIRGEQSEDMLERRMSCLERHRLEARALSEAFASADARTVDKVAEALSALSPVTECGDREALARRVAPPPPAAREGVTRVRAEIAQARAVNLTGRPAAAAPLAAAAVEHARAVPYPLVGAEALQSQAVIEENAAHFEAAVEIGTRALWAALAAGDDDLAVNAGIELVRIHGDKLVREKETRLWMGTTEALLARTGHRDALVAHYEWEAGDAEVSLHRSEVGLAHYQRALELCRKLGARHCEAKALQGIAEVKLAASEDTAAQEALEKALAIVEGEFGKDSPMLVSPLEQLGRIQEDELQFAAATKTLTRALALAEPRFGKEHPIVAQISRALADAAWGEDRLDEALAYAKSSEVVFAKTTGEDSVYVRQALLTQAGVLRAMKRYPEAIAVSRRILAMSEGEARIDPLLALAQAWLAQGDPRKAEEPLSAAVGLIEQVGRHDGTTAAIWFGLAKSLWDGGGNRARARRFAERALKDFGDLAEHQAGRAEVREWLTAHPAAAPR